MALTENHKFALVLLTSFVVQIPAVIWGFELCDSGFYLTFYENVFSHPEAVQYNFMYYMNGLLGWLLLRLTGGSLLGIRIAGALVNVAVALMAWSLLRGRGRLFPFLCGVAVVGIGSWGCTLTFNYDLATMLLASLSFWLMLKALDSRRIWMLVLSGVVCGMNAFSRLPNFIDILFVLVIPAAVNNHPFSRQSMRMMGDWLSGWGIGVALVLLFAICAGHMDELVSSAASMFQAGSSERGESIHSMRHLISSNVRTWLPILACAFSFGAFLLLTARSVRRRWFGSFSSGIACGVVAFILILSLIICRDSDINSLRVWIFAVAVGGGVMALLLRDDTFRRLRIVALCGLFMVVLLPAGSDGVVYGPGPLVVGFLMPASLCVVEAIAGGRSGRSIVAGFSLFILAVYCMGLGRGIAYFDSNPVSEMTSGIDIRKTGGILTTEANARLYEEVFSELDKHVSAGDTLMVYGSGPMVNYLTGTLPALGCSWPEQFTPGQLRHWLETSQAPEYVMMLKFQTLAKVNTCYPDLFVRGYAFDRNCEPRKPDVYHTVEKSGIVFDYLNANGYTLITDTPRFLLYRR